MLIKLQEIFRNIYFEEDLRTATSEDCFQKFYIIILDAIAHTVISFSLMTFRAIPILIQKSNIGIHTSMGFLEGSYRLQNHTCGSYIATII